jgi:hypothetical protein
VPQAISDELVLGSVGEAALVRGRTRWAPPPGGDGPARFELAFRGGTGAVPVELPQGAVAAVVVADGAAVLDPAETLWHVAPDGQRTRLATSVTSAPVASSDGTRLSWAVRSPTDEGAFDVHLREGAADRVVARGLGSATPLAFDPRTGALVLVGAVPGGVAGLFVALPGAAGARCLTNCDLHTGEPWGERFRAPPGEARAIAFTGDGLRYQDDTDRPVTVTYGQVAP